MAMAAKAKLLLRELKTVKADFAFAKERCAQLEEENKILRENHERGENLEDDDLVHIPFTMIHFFSICSYLSSNAVIIWKMIIWLLTNYQNELEMWCLVMLGMRAEKRIR